MGPMRYRVRRSVLAPQFWITESYDYLYVAVYDSWEEAMASACLHAYKDALERHFMVHFEYFERHPDVIHSEDV